MTTEKIRVRASAVISSAAATNATATNCVMIESLTVSIPEVNLATVPANPSINESQPGSLVLLCLAAWAVPGAGHLWLGRRSKGLIFFAAIPLMFIIGLAVEGRLFPFDFTEPLVGLAAVADIGNGLPYFLAGIFGFGNGD